MASTAARKARDGQAARGWQTREGQEELAEQRMDYLPGPWGARTRAKSPECRGRQQGCRRGSSVARRYFSCTLMFGNIHRPQFEVSFWLTLRRADFEPS